jgi:hypothetical protein
MTDNCLLCLEELTFPLSEPKFCNCKILLHYNCMRQIENSGLACPICRIKIEPNIHIQQELDPVTWFLFKYPNFLTYILFILWVFVASIFFIIPVIILRKIKREFYH